MKKRLYWFVISMVVFIGCNERKENKITINNQEIFEISMSKDTIAKNEYLRCFAYLENPSFKDKDSEIMVFLESNEVYPLEEDLSNEYDIPMEVFINLTLDTINQKWFEGYSYSKTVAFGRKFSSSGKKKIRGYILEYYDQDPRVLVDSIVEKDKIRRYYFEREIYVTDIDSISN